MTTVNFPVGGIFYPENMGKTGLMDEMPNLDFSQPFPQHTAPFFGDGRYGAILNEHIARVEALKIRILGYPELSEAKKQAMFHELDLLRGAFIEIASHQSTSRLHLDMVADLPFLGNDGQKSLILEGILGQSDPIESLLRIISKISPTDLTVLLEGETGTGKELFARIIHLNSNRIKFVAVNCGAFPAGLIESELFGHIKGAFTGATTDRKGKFEEADRGTIFLDEIGDLELSAQVNLLRVLEQGELQRVGSDKPYRIDVRVIAATNKNLETMVKQGIFREDLYFRLNVCPLHIPPLRERRDEIETLLEYFLQEMAGPNGKIPKLSRELRQFILRDYSFPGNIRELKNLAKYIFCIADNEPVAITDLPERYRRVHLLGEEDEEESENMMAVRRDAEKEFLVKSLEKHKGNVQRICNETGLSRSRIYQMLKKYTLRPTDFR